MAGVTFTSRKGEVLTALKANTRKGLQAASIEVASEAKRLTPVDTGRLRSSLGWNVSDLTAVIGTNVEYAPFVHENMDARHVVGQAKFLETAARSKADRVQQLIQRALEGRL